MRTILLLITFTVLSCTSLYAQESDNVRIPNIFTPNQDEVNDLFTIKTSGIEDLKCTIYNRYGETIYRFYGINGHWDGRTHAGIRCPDGVYFYLIELQKENGETSTKNGSVHLISGFNGK